jgi:hypothetical protein
MWRTVFIVAVATALLSGCHDVKSESAANFHLERGQTWDWVPNEVQSWKEYRRVAEHERVAVHEAYVGEREARRDERHERWQEPVGPERAEERREEMYDPQSELPVGDEFEAEEDRVLKREHKHIQKSIAGELSERGVRRVTDQTPTYYVAYYLFSGGRAVAPREYAAYEERTEWGDEWRRFAEDTLVIDVVDPATGSLLWSGSGIGRTRLEEDYAGDEGARMRGVKKAVRDIVSSKPAYPIKAPGSPRVR